MRKSLVMASVLAVPLICGCGGTQPPGASGRIATSAPPTGSPAAPAGPASTGTAGAADQSARTCTAADLRASFRPDGEGAGGHYVSLLDLRNVGSTRCRLSGYPDRVTVFEAGRPRVVATDGSFFPIRDSRPMAPGGSTTLGIETDSTCAARPSGGPSGPLYHEVRVQLGNSWLTIRDARGLDVGCGVHLTRFGRWS